MNFLYQNASKPSGGGAEAHPLQLTRPKVKLQPRRLRSMGNSSSSGGGGGTGVSQQDCEVGERPVRTHLFMDLNGGGGGGQDPPVLGPGRRRSPGLLDRLASVSSVGGGGGSRREQRRSRSEQAPSIPLPVQQQPAAPQLRPELAAKELQSLDQLDQDCFIIPCELVDRFLPTGHKLPPSTPVKGQRLNMRETNNPGLAVVFHLLTRMEPVMSNPLSAVSPLHVQLGACTSLLRHVVRLGHTRDAILLSNLERTEEFPFLLYYTVDKQRSSAAETFTAVLNGVRETFTPLQLHYTGQHTVKLYDEVAAIVRPPLSDQRTPASDRTGYIVSIFRVMEGDDRQSFERDWLGWTGARLLYRSIPACAGLRRIVLHKSCNAGDIYYVLSCECSALLDNVVASVRALPALRARLVGYTGVYKPMVVS